MRTRSCVRNARRTDSVPTGRTHERERGEIRDDERAQKKTIQTRMRTRSHVRNVRRTDSVPPGSAHERGRSEKDVPTNLIQTRKGMRARTGKQENKNRTRRNKVPTFQPDRPSSQSTSLSCSAPLHSWTFGQNLLPRLCALGCRDGRNMLLYIAGVALAQSCAYIAHNNLVVRKIMEAMRTAYTKRGIRSQHVSNSTRGKRSRKAREYCQRKARIVCEQRSISLNRLMNQMVSVLLKYVIRFSISFRWCAFPNFCTQNSRPLAYTYASPQKLARLLYIVRKCMDDTRCKIALHVLVSALHCSSGPF